MILYISNNQSTILYLIYLTILYLIYTPHLNAPLLNALPCLFNIECVFLTFYRGSEVYLSINLANPAQSIDISGEISSRISGDEKLSIDLKTEISNRKSTDNLLFTEISTKLIDNSGVTNLHNISSAYQFPISFFTYARVLSRG